MLRSIDPKGSWLKGKNSVAEPWVPVREDVERIKAGQATKVNETYAVNGRVYGTHEGRFHPISGPGIHSLNRKEFNGLAVLNKLGEGEQSVEILQSMQLSPEQINRLLQIWRERQ